MSAVVMVADAWKPSIVQLVPFANKKIQRHSSLKETSSSSAGSKRCFPILAVTRSQSGISQDDSIVSLETLNSLAFSDYKSEVSDSVPYSGRTPTVSVKKDRGFRKIARHSSMRENRSDMMVKFAVQDLNDQSCTTTPRRSSVSSSDTGISLSTVSANGSVASNGLPKPIFSDKKYLYRQNGFKKSAPFTPGEIELQKQKEQYAKEQAQRQKKYKLNVNQLPRSNTPINDHDPDKLNMKQVIRFLQKQKPPVSPRPDTHISRSPDRRSVEIAPKTAPANFTMGDKIRSDLKTSDSMRSRASEISITSRSKLMSRDSDISSKGSSTPNSRFNMSHKHESGHVHKHESGHMHKHERGHVHKHDNVHLTRSQSDRKDKVAKSFTDDVRDRNSRSSNENGKERDKNKHSRKRVKEFKLHRFLALAPNAEGQKTNPLIISNLTQTKSNNWVSTREGLKSEGGAKKRSKSEDRISQMRVSSERPLPSHYRALNKDNSNNKTDLLSPDNVSDGLIGRSMTETDKYNLGKTTTLMHQRTRFQKISQKDDISVTDSDDGKVSRNSSSMIRLPSVHDFLEEEDDDTIHNSSKSDLEVTSIAHESENDYEQKRETNISRVSVDSSRSSVYIPILSSSPRKGFLSPKHRQSIRITLPKEEEETKAIRLSLRQEKDLTAQRSYMHDIASNRTPELTMMYSHANGQISVGSGESFYDRNLIRISAVPMQSRMSGDCGSCDDRSVSPDSHITSRTIGALSIS